LTGESGAIGTGKRSTGMFRTGFCLSFLALFVLVACGEKVPESSAAKQVGGTPKQIVDKAAADAAAAANQGAERSQSEEDKK